MKIAIGSDHGGFALKEKLKVFLRKHAISFHDFGAYGEDAVDYPDFARKVAKAVAAKKYARGVLVCGSGVGVAMAANKIKGIRAVQVYDAYSAEMSRRHNDANVITFAGRRMKPSIARHLLNLWLKTPFEGGRHLRRVKKIG